MGLYNFKPRFVPYIEEGSKTHTIRAHRVVRDSVGDTMHLYTGLRQKGARLLGRFPCIKVEEIRITETQEVLIDGVQLDREERDLLAWRDGFRLDQTVFAHGDPHVPLHVGCFEMLMMPFWVGRLPFEGEIYHWRWSK